MGFDTRLKFKRSLKFSILISLFFSVLLLGLNVLVHDHDEHHCHDHHQGEETCVACAYCSSAQGIEVEVFTFTVPFRFEVTLLLYETPFSPLRLTANVRSRAPPVFSDQNLGFIF